MKTHHIMYHPDKVKKEGHVQVNLNAWAGMRRKGYVFATDKEQRAERERVGAIAEKAKDKRDKEKE